jgi:type IV pilus assembly protein PilW
MNKPSHTMLCHPARSGGFTIVEVMVALAISAILILGVINIFMASRTSYTMQSGVSRLQENARFALDVMSRSIGMAGLDTDGNGVPVRGFNLAATLDNNDENADFRFTQANGKASDSISVTYDSATDCLGQNSGGTATDTFYISGTSLMCLGNGSGTPQPIADGIENMQILYGEDTDADGIANRYVSAANVSDWGSNNGGIASIRIALLADTVDEVDKDISKDATYRLLNSPTLGPFNDVDGTSWYIDANGNATHDPDEILITSMVRRVFTRTILLRNYPFTP